MHEGGGEGLGAEVGGGLGRVGTSVQELEDRLGVAVVEQPERVWDVDRCVEQRRIRELGEVVHPSRFYRSGLILLQDRRALTSKSRVARVSRGSEEFDGHAAGLRLIWDCLPSS